MSSAGGLRLVASILLTLTLGAVAAAAQAGDYVGDEVCARVVIEIEQELILKRQGFEARMRITNSVEDRTVEDGIGMLLKDGNGDRVQAMQAAATVAWVGAL